MPIENDTLEIHTLFNEFPLSAQNRLGEYTLNFADSQKLNEKIACITREKKTGGDTAHACFQYLYNQKWDYLFDLWKSRQEYRQNAHGALSVGHEWYVSRPSAFFKCLKTLQYRDDTITRTAITGQRWYSERVYSTNGTFNSVIAHLNLSPWVKTLFPPYRACQIATAAVLNGLRVPPNIFWTATAQNSTCCDKPHRESGRTARDGVMRRSMMLKFTWLEFWIIAQWARAAYIDKLQSALRTLLFLGMGPMFYEMALISRIDPPSEIRDRLEHRMAPQRIRNIIEGSGIARLYSERYINVWRHRLKTEGQADWKTRDFVEGYSAITKDHVRPFDYGV